LRVKLTEVFLEELKSLLFFLFIHYFYVYAIWNSLWAEESEYLVKLKNSDICEKVFEKNLINLWQIWISWVN